MYYIFSAINSTPFFDPKRDNFAKKRRNSLPRAADVPLESFLKVSVASSLHR